MQPWESCFHVFLIREECFKKIYAFILTLSSQSDTKIKNVWQTELGIQLSEAVWEHAISRIWSTTSCAFVGLIQSKVIYRAHFSNSRLSEIYRMWKMKCHGSPCHLVLCPKLLGFCTDHFSYAFGVNLQSCPLITTKTYTKGCYSLHFLTSKTFFIVPLKVHQKSLYLPVA